MKKKLNIYCDMDGVLADFNGETDAVDRFRTEKGFFKKLRPLNDWAFKQLLARKDINLFILSASPNAAADGDKVEWLKYHYPQIKKSHIIIMRVGEKKLNYMRTQTGILLDDYGKNCREWEERDGNRAIKITKSLQEHFNEFLPMAVLDY